MRKRRTLHHDDLIRAIKNKVGDDADIVVGPALSFLFLLGRLEYHVKNDSFEYLEPRPGR